MRILANFPPEFYIILDFFLFNVLYLLMNSDYAIKGKK